MRNSDVSIGMTVRHKYRSAWGVGVVLSKGTICLPYGHGYKDVAAWVVDFEVKSSPVKCIASDLERVDRKEK